MKISLENQPTGIENRILEKLEKILGYANSTISLIKSKKPCEDVFDQFAKIKNMVKNIESLLLENQLKKCFLTDFPQLRELFATIQNLRMKGFGALIVIEREDSIKEIVTENNLGVLIDAKISGKLLENIFYPGTPLHDGAVVIRGKRVFSAGSVLPLTKRVISGKKLGTRHRAALGLSEVSDADIIVVSEETKKVSIAFRGEFFSFKEITTLTEFIMD